MFTTYLRNFGLSFLLLLTPLSATTGKAIIRIGIIDSGLPPNFKQFPICASKDFTNTDIVDDLGHGTNITNLVTNNLDKDRYCLVVAKVFSSKEIGTPMERVVAALIFLHENKVSVVNLSLGSLEGFDHMEKTAIQMLLNEAVVVAAAGNNSKNLDEKCNYYPACYSNRILVVGNGFSNSDKAFSSNYGKYVKVWEDGEKQCGGGICQSGTSQATAKATNKVVRRMMQSTEQNDEEYREAAFRAGEALIKYHKIDENVKNFADGYTEPLDKKLQVYLKRMPATVQKSLIIFYNAYEIAARQKVVITYGF